MSPLHIPAAHHRSSSRLAALGAGLGLAVARSLTDAMGGRLQIGATEVGTGNDFLFALPLIDETAPVRTR